MPVSELELELKTGQLEDLMVLCLHWIEKYQLKIDFRHKAQRGETLSQLRLLADPVSDESEVGTTAHEGAWPSLIEEQLTQSVKASQAADKSPQNTLFEQYLGHLKPLELLQLLASEIASLAELEDQKVAEVDKNYRLYLILQLAVLLDNRLGSDQAESSQGLHALLDAFLPQPEAADNTQGQQDPNRTDALTQIFKNPEKHTNLLSKIKNALYSAPFQMDLTTKLASLVRS